MRTKLKTVKINIQTVDGKRVVKSFDFYKTTGLLRNNYTRWMTETALSIGEPGEDFFPCPGNIERKEISVFIKYRIRYYFSVPFAIILCGVARRKEAMQLMAYLKKQA